MLLSGKDIPKEDIEALIKKRLCGKDIAKKLGITRKTLYNIRNNSAGIEYLYVLRIEKDGCHFIFDLDSNNKNGVATTVTDIFFS